MVQIPVESLKRWWTNRYGTISRKDGRWFRYFQHYNQVRIPPTPNREYEFKIIFSFHKVISARHFYQLFFKVTKWQFLTMPDDTKFWIENSATNIFRPGLDFNENLKDMKGPACLIVATPWEGDPHFWAFSQYDCDKAFVSFRNPREQVLFKLSHT